MLTFVKTRYLKEGYTEDESTKLAEDDYNRKVDRVKKL